jgi:hypothetical protein
MLARLGVVAILISGCAAANGPNGSGDGGNGGPICPAHPDQCGGMCCGQICVEVMSDPQNCGACGHVCDPGQVCMGGSCGCQPTGAMCGQGQSCCNQVGCKSLMSDAFNCGTCGNRCGPGGACTNGQCTCGGTMCMSGQVCCNGSCASSCVNDMGMAFDLSSSSGLCMCSNHCAPDLFKICVGPDCCYDEALLGTCMPSSTCQFNQNP